ncbi:DNA gyrase inhibitor YacG [Dinoroseobacter shibae]|uniref:DNA gyrase inhibitor YacG n=1 Tax=Dinoroseobacter shibae TaxID=215813 RepID=UPI0000E99F14|nr:DNA gyrase inhibitor YacG [Dinoroseobacter shibae]URF47666.1 DNA gyrase inhibitor YacG [Dinoroseobacter shibae]URF51976.1 DNA gyrase inhibitor YacG [Dinoroseobacter shibae]
MTCPICRKPTLHAYRPFCSKRCSDVDLGRWLTGGYAIPSEREEDDEEAEDAAREAGSSAAQDTDPTHH